MNWPDGYSVLRSALKFNTTIYIYIYIFIVAQVCHKASQSMVIIGSGTGFGAMPLPGAVITNSLQWRHYGHDGVSNHQHHECLLNRLFRRRSKKSSKLRATGLCAGNSPVTCEFPAQMSRNAENASIWWRHHVANCTLSLYNTGIFNQEFENVGCKMPAKILPK